MALRLESAHIGQHQLDVERLYRAVADGEPQREIMEMIYDLLGHSYQLRPPLDELKLARRCGTRSVSRG
jgi:hypothetical protein